MACSAAISAGSSHMAEESARQDSAYLCRIQQCSGPRQRRTVVPGHPLRGSLLQFLRVPLQLVQIVERIGAIQLAGVDQAHEQIADTGLHFWSCRIESSCGVRWISSTLSRKHYYPVVPPLAAETK